MDAEVFIELDAIQKLVKTAALGDNARHSVAWCLGNLPALYQELARTYDDRYGSEIRRTVQAVLLKLAEKSPDSPDAPKVTEAVLSQLHALHERLGLQGLEFKPPAKKKTPSRARKVA